MIRKRVFQIIEASDGKDRISSVYDVAMIFVIVVSLIPLAFKESTPAFTVMEWITTGIFIIDYLLRLWTADIKLDKGPASFLIYPLTPLAIIDLLCILPSFAALSGSFRILKVVRLLRAFRVFRAFKALRYSKNMIIIANVIREQKTALLAVFSLAVSYILISALVIFNVEPDSFGDYFDAVYWATVSLTTVGYGDIYPVTDAGRIITMLSSILGIAVVALPAGIITAGYMSEIEKDRGISENE